MTFQKIPDAASILEIAHECDWNDPHETPTGNVILHEVAFPEAGGEPEITDFFDSGFISKSALADLMRTSIANFESGSPDPIRAPFGYARDNSKGKPIAEPKEQAVMAKMREILAQGFTLREIADELNAQGFDTRNGY